MKIEKVGKEGTPWDVLPLVYLSETPPIDFSNISHSFHLFSDQCSRASRDRP
jgi:hypothetical protein